MCFFNIFDFDGDGKGSVEEDILSLVMLDDLFDEDEGQTPTA